MPYRLLDIDQAAMEPASNAGVPLVNVGETLSTLLVELEAELANRSDVDDPRMTKWINWAYRSMCGSLDLKELYGSVMFNLEVDQPFYRVPVQVGAIKKVSIINETDYADGGLKLMQIDEDIYTRLPDLDGEPTNYFRFNRMMVLYPDPETIREMPVSFKIRPDDLVDGQDSPILPQEFHEPLLLLSRHRAWRSLLVYDKAAAAKNDYVDSLSLLLNTDAEEAAELPSGVSFVKHQRDLTRIGRVDRDLDDRR